MFSITQEQLKEQAEAVSITAAVGYGCGRVFTEQLGPPSLVVTVALTHLLIKQAMNKVVDKIRYTIINNYYSYSGQEKIFRIQVRIGSIKQFTPHLSAIATIGLFSLANKKLPTSVIKHLPTAIINASPATILKPLAATFLLSREARNMISATRYIFTGERF